MTGYRIEYSRDGNQWRHLDDTGSSHTSFTHTGLNANVEMQYRIYAMNSVGRSEVSDGATGSTAASVAPGMPTNPVIGLSPAATDVHLKWTPPADPDGDRVSHYRVQARTSDTDDGGWMPLHAGKVIARTNEYNFGGDDLRTHAGIAYPQSIAANEDALVYIDIRVAAINRMNTSSGDDADDVAWLTVENVPVGHEDAPKKAGTPEVKHDEHQHQGRSGLDVTWPKAAFIQNQGPSDAAFGSAVQYILVTDGVEALPPVTHATALARGGNTDKPGADDNGLATETVRTYHVYAVNAAVDGSVPGASVRSFPSNMKKGKTARPQLPGRPENFTVTADGHTEIKLMWGPPMTDDERNLCEATDAAPTEDDGSECGNSVITGYRIQMSKTGTGGWKDLKEMAGGSEYIATMLMPGERYHYRVAALNSRGQGPYSEVRSEETHEAGEPTPPGGLVAQAYGPTAIKLCWVEQNLVDPLTGEERLDEGLPVLGYKITYLMSDGTEKVLEENTGSMDTQYTAMGLRPGTEYTFMVYSITLGGVGEEPATASASTADAMVPDAPHRP